MASATLGAALRRIHELYTTGSSSGLADGQLVERFLARGDEAAFARLVARHRPMVLGVCRGILRDQGAAEDAFQATFLILVRKAASVRGRDTLGGWLHRVAAREW